MKIDKIRKDFELYQVFIYNFSSKLPEYPGCIYQSQKELKHFGLETLVIHGILDDVVLNILKYMF